MKYSLLILLVMSSVASAYWDNMEVRRASMYVCDDESCSYVDSANTSQVPFLSGVAFIGTDRDGLIDYIQVSGSIATDGVQYYFQRQIMVTARAGGQRILYGMLWNGTGWEPGVAVHMYQIQDTKLKFMIQYGDPESAEVFAINSMDD